MTTTHTPGPWTIDRSGATYNKPHIRANGWILAWLPDNSAGMVTPSAFSDARETDEANARLIAEAPAMLAELKSVIAYLQGSYDDDTAYMDDTLPDVHPWRTICALLARIEPPTHDVR